MDYQTGESVRVTRLPDFGPPSLGLVSFLPMAVSPDGSRLAYACGKTDLCLTDLDGRERTPSLPPAFARSRGIARAHASPQRRSTITTLGRCKCSLSHAKGEVQHKVAVAAATPPILPMDTIAA